MKAAVFHGCKDVRIEDIPARRPLPGEVTVRIEACGICGTDIHIFEGAEGAAKTVPPLVLGHEFSGVIWETGDPTGDLKPGDRVCIDPNDMCGGCYYCRRGMAHFCENMTGIGTTINGGFAEYCTVRRKQVYKMSDSLSFEEGAMTEPLACCLHGMDLVGLKQGQTVMILGGGTIGQIMLQLAKISGASAVILSEPVAAKRLLAAESGADIVVDPLKDDVEGVLRSHGIKAVDAVIECVGRTNTMTDAVRFAGKGGTVMLFGLTDPGAEIPLKPFDIFKKEISIKASFINPYTQGRALALLESGKIDVKRLIAARIGLEELPGALESTAKSAGGKIIVTPQQPPVTVR